MKNEQNNLAEIIERLSGKKPEIIDFPGIGEMISIPMSSEQAFGMGQIESDPKELRPLIRKRDTVFNPMTGLPEDQFTMYSNVNTYLTTKNLPTNPVDLYMRRNTLINVFKSRVIFLFKIINQIVKRDFDMLTKINIDSPDPMSKRYRYMPEVGPNMIKYSYLTDLFKFTGLVTKESAKDISNNMAVDLYNLLYDSLDHLITTNQISNCDFSKCCEGIETICLAFALNIKETLRILIDEANQIYTPAGDPTKFPDMCINVESSFIDMTKPINQQSQTHPFFDEGEY